MYIKAKKSLGQNFLIDREVLEKIVSITDVANKEVLEIGPGSGNLTTYILKQKPKKLYVVEKDDDLAILLKEKFGPWSGEIRINGNPKVILIASKPNKAFIGEST